MTTASTKNLGWRGLLKGEQIHALARNLNYGKRGRITAADLQEGPVTTKLPKWPTFYEPQKPPKSTEDHIIMQLLEHQVESILAKDIDGLEQKLTRHRPSRL